jgi:hypothetical protein
MVVAVLSAVAIAASGCGGDSDAEAEFRAAFKERFGTPGDETSWYGHITGMKLSSGRLEITTDLAAKRLSADETETVMAICSAALKFVLDTEALDGRPTTGVIGSDGAVLGNCA